MKIGLIVYFQLESQNKTITGDFTSKKLLKTADMIDDLTSPPITKLMI